MKDFLTRRIQVLDEINFKEIFTHPSRLFGYSYLYVLIIIVGIGIYFVQKLPEMNKNSIVPIISDTSSVEQDLPFELPKNLPPIDLKLIKSPTSDILNRGKIFYESNCASCHGEKGLGDGVAGVVMNPKPRNFTVNDGWINGRKFSEMYKTLQEGLVKSGMPAFNHVNPEDLIATIHYIRSFSGDFPPVNEDEVNLLDQTYKISEGKKTSGQIPVSVAMIRVVSENRELVKKQKQIRSKLEINKQFNSLIQSKDKFVSTLVKISSTGEHKNESLFLQKIKSNPIWYGLKPEILKLSNEDLKNFYSYSISLLGDNN